MAIRRTEISKEEGFAMVQKYLSNIQSAKTLDSIFNLHKQMWKDGIRHRGFGPNEGGMFRCRDISNMSKDEVHLGNVHGIWTNTLAFFENGFHNGTIDMDTYQKVTRQYRNQLVGNLEYIRSQFYDCGLNLNRLRTVIEDHINDTTSSTLGRHVTVRDIEKGIIPGEMKDITLSLGGKDYKSSMLVILYDDLDVRVYVPSSPWGRQNGYLPPHVTSLSEVKNTDWIDLSDRRIYHIEPTLLRNKFVVSNIERSTVRTDSFKQQKNRQENRFKNYFKH